jgi:hypothetical protein
MLGQLLRGDWRDGAWPLMVSSSKALLAQISIDSRTDGI